MRELIDRIFSTPELITLQTLRLSADEAAALRTHCHLGWPGDTVLVLAPERNDSVLGYVVMDDVKGKDQYITYALAVTRDLRVTDVEILVYREPYGYEVKHQSWREQFVGKTPGDRLRHGREIRNISGATISSRAVTLGVKKILCTLQILQQRLPH
jgi:Na+-translocating ferredoxin:NAD+ oxidoreductase RnfG subunit